MGVNGEALQLHAVYKKPYFYYKSRENPCQVPYTSVLHPNVQQNQRFVYIYDYHYSTKLYQKNIIITVTCTLVATHIYSNKHVIFSSIALYHSDTCI